jgi:plastocyanin
MRFLLVASSLALVAYVHHGAQELTITQKSKTFSESTLTLHLGDRVIFKNDDVVAHNVFSGSQAFAFNLKLQAPGTSAPVTFDKPGVVDVRCAFHPTMKLVITVRD